MASAKTLFATARAAGVDILNEGFDDVNGSGNIDNWLITLLPLLGRAARQTRNR